MGFAVIQAVPLVAEAVLERPPAGRRLVVQGVSPMLKRATAPESMKRQGGPASHDCMTMFAALLLAFPSVPAPLQMPPRPVPASIELKLDVRLPDGTAADAAEVVFHHHGDPNTSSRGRWTGPDKPVRVFADAGTLHVYVDPVEMDAGSLPGAARHRSPSYASFDGELIAPFASKPIELDLTKLA